MEWNQLIASCRSCVFEATGDSEADHRDQHGDGDHYADHDHEEDDDDAQSCSCDSWGYNLGSAMEVDDAVDEGQVEDHQLEFYNHDCPPASSRCEMGGLFGGLSKERKEEEEREEEGVVVSNELGFLSNGLIKMTKEMEDRLFWERCLATGY